MEEAKYQNLVADILKENPNERTTVASAPDTGGGDFRNEVMIE